MISVMSFIDLFNISFFLIFFCIWFLKILFLFAYNFFNIKMSFIFSFLCISRFLNFFIVYFIYVLIVLYCYLLFSWHCQFQCRFKLYLWFYSSSLFYVVLKKYFWQPY
jgi:hypothetical protein